MRQIVDLPPDILYIILGSLADEPATLRACALAGNWALTTCARTMLYNHIVLSDFPIHAAQMPLLARTIASNPALGALVTALLITDARGVVPWYPYPRQPLLRPALLPFCHLLQLRVLKLHQLRIMGVEGLLATLAMLPRLECLGCDTLWDQRACHRNTIDDDADVGLTEITGIDSFPKLKELVISGGYWRHAAFALRLLRNYRMGIANLEVIAINLEQATQALRWVPVIRAASATLRTLSMSLSDRMLRDEETPSGAEQYGTSLSALSANITHSVLARKASAYEYVFDNLAHCPALRQLTFTYQPDAHTCASAAPPHGLPHALCAFLARRAPPVPALEHLTLALPVRTRHVGFGADDSARLAGSLLDPVRYPCFRVLTLRVWRESWYRDKWNRNPHQSRAGQEAMVGQVRAAFAPFGRAGAVGLDVQAVEKYD